MHFGCHLLCYSRSDSFKTVELKKKAYAVHRLAISNDIHMLNVLPTDV